MTINEKSTKAEMWQAYKELLAKFEGGTVSVSAKDTKLDKLNNGLLAARDELLATFETALSEVQSTAQEQQAIQDMLAKRKIEIIAELEKARAELQAAIDDTRKLWEIEKSDTKRDREREAEEYTYELNKKRRDEEAAYAAKRQQREAELNTREALIKEQESELADLRKAVEQAPKELEVAVKTMRETLAAELKAEHAAETKDAKQQAEHVKSIIELRLQTAETAVAARDKQITELQNQLQAAQSQLKDMAVTVIRSSSAQHSVPVDATR